MAYARGSQPVREVVERGPSLTGRLVGLATRLTVRPALVIGSYLPWASWPWGLADLAVQAATPVASNIHDTIRLTHCTGRLVRAVGVPPVDGAHRVVLYLHGGGFLMRGTSAYERLVTTLSKYADAPVLLVDYRTMPGHSIGAAIDDCDDGYRWLRRQGHRPDQIVLAGDSVGAYLALALAERLLAEGERPAAIVVMSPLIQIAGAARQAHPNIATDAMFSAAAFDAFADLVAQATERHVVNGHPKEIYEPLDHVEAGLPPTLIHVSGSEALLHDARLAARSLAAAGVPVELRVWPGQVHVFQLAAPLVPEATRSLRQIGEYIRAATAVGARGDIGVQRRVRG